MDWLLKNSSDYYFGPHLPKASFPESFSKYYASMSDESFDVDRDAFVANFESGKEVLFVESIHNPYHIYFFNWSLSESMYAEKVSVIIPKGFYVFGDAINDRNYQRYNLLVCLKKDSDDYGKIYAWYRAYDPIGEGDNSHGVGYVAPDLQSFVEGLKNEAEIKDL